MMRAAEVTSSCWNNPADPERMQLHYPRELGQTAAAD